MSGRQLAEELLAACPDEAARRAVERVLRGWQGQCLRLPHLDRQRPRELAELVARTCHDKSEALDILTERTGLSRDRCRHLLAEERKRLSL